jgi:hypothetical protein
LGVVSRRTRFCPSSSFDLTFTDRTFDWQLPQSPFRNDRSTPFNDRR